MTEFEEIEIFDTNLDNSAKTKEKESRGLSHVSNRYVDRRGQPSAIITDRLEVTFDVKDLLFPEPAEEQLTNAQVQQRVNDEFAVNNNINITDR